MYLKSIKILPIQLPLKQAFGSHHETLQKRNLTLLQLMNDAGQQAIGELVSFDTPTYSAEIQATDRWLLIHDLIPRLRGKKINTPWDVQQIFAGISGNSMAIAALEMPVWQLFAQKQDLYLSQLLAQYTHTQVRYKIPVGISLGLTDWPHLKQQVQRALKQGYGRLKVKVDQVSDFKKIAALRQLFPKLPMMVDGNSAFTKQDFTALQILDTLNLAMIEQPFAPTDFVDHAWLRQRLNTPICLDENIHNLADVRTATHLGSTNFLNLKPARVGGFAATCDMINYALQHDLSCWVGGMVESDLGRYYSQSLAQLSCFDFPGDVGPAQQFFSESLCLQQPILQNGQLSFEKISKLGPSLKPEILAQFDDLPNQL